MPVYPALFLKNFFVVGGIGGTTTPPMRSLIIARSAVFRFVEPKGLYFILHNGFFLFAFLYILPIVFFFFLV